MSLPVIRGASAALYPFTMTISFRTVVGRFQNGAEQRQIAQPGALVQFELPYALLTRTQKDTIKAAVSAAKGQFDTGLALTLGATVYSNLSLDSDEFAAMESAPARYAAPLKLSQAVTQNLSPGTPGQPFPTLGNGAMSVLPYTQRKVFQTVASKMPSGPKYTLAEFAGSLTGYPADGLMGWILDERGLSDGDLSIRQLHFIANWGRAYWFSFTDEDGTTYTKAHYASDTLICRYNGPNNSDVRIEIEVTNN